MKNLLFANLLAPTTLATVQAQAVPNGTFETWNTRTGIAAPQGWLNVDDIIPIFTGFPLPASTNTVVRTATSHSGAFAVQMVTTSVPQVGTLRGQLLLGTRFSRSGAPVQRSGVPYTGRPAQMEFYYKLTGASAATDSASAKVQLTRTVAGTTIVVAEGTLIFRSLAPAFVLASVPLVYGPDGGLADTLRIGFSTALGRIFTRGTTLTVDDVTLAGTAAATRDAGADAALTLYPTSSATGQYTLAAPGQPALLHNALVVTDLTGRVVLRQPAPTGAADSRRLELPAGLAPGLYTLTLDAATGPLTRKLVLEQ